MSILKNKKFLDIIFSICWFIMDFCWFLDLNFISYLFATVGFIIVAYFHFKMDSTEMISQGVNMYWFCMNFNWFIYDWTGSIINLFMTYFFFGLAAVFIILYLIDVVKEHKDLENPLKRFK